MPERPSPIDHDPRPEALKRRTFVYVVCSPQGRVGKTLTARLLIDYFLSSSRPTLGFDTNHFEPALAPAFPRATSVVDLGSTRGQMELFDRLIEPDEVPKVIDLWHVAYEPFFKQAQELGFFEEAWERGIEPVILLVTDQKERFVHEIRALSKQWRDLKLVLVYNEGAAKLPDDMGFPKSLRLREHLLIPELDIVVRRVVDQPNTLLDRMIHEPSPGTSFVIEARVRALLGPFFDQFEMLERKLVMENASFLG